MEIEGIPIKEEATYLGINLCKNQTIVFKVNWIKHYIQNKDK